MAHATSLAGTWTYRSYLNQPNQQPLGAGVFTFETPSHATLTGTLVMTPELILDLKGTVQPATASAPLTVHIQGFGRPGSKTDGWEYDYHASLAFHWPAGIDQVDALVGSVIRVKEHNGNPAGVTGSFILVRQS